MKTDEMTPRDWWLALARDVTVGVLLAAIVVAVVLMTSSTPPAFVYGAF